MPRDLRPPVWLVGLALIAMFVITAIAVPNRPLTEALRIMQISVGSVVLFAYGVDAWAAARKRYLDHGEQLTLGICVGFAAVVFGGIWALLWRLAGQPAWMYNSDFNAFMAFLVIIAGTLHITAPGAINGIVPRRNWIWWGCAVGLAVLVSTMILSLQPDVRWIVDGIEPFMRD